MSKKIIPIEYRYEIYNKELLAIMKSFEEFYLELISAPLELPTIIYSDYRAL